MDWFGHVCPEFFSNGVTNGGDARVYLAAFRSNTQAGLILNAHFSHKAGDDARDGLLKRIFRAKRFFMPPVARWILYPGLRSSDKRPLRLSNVRPIGAGSFG
jgi:hypothetical protein